MSDRIIMYGTTWCGDCRRAEQVFKAEGVEYDWVDIGEHPEAAILVETVNQGMRCVPTIIFPDGDVMVEPASPALAAKLRSLK